jgi:hypothetical protein
VRSTIREDRARRAAGSPSGPIRHHHNLNIDTNPYPQPIFQHRPISLNSPIDQHPPGSSSIPYTHPFNLAASGSGSGSDNSLPPTRPPSVASSVGPSESASAWVQNHLDVPYSSRSRQCSISRQWSEININPALAWSPESQRSFETRLARLTASAGFPLSWVDNPEWIAFCDDTSVISIFKCTLLFGLNVLPIFRVLMPIKCETTFLVGVAAKTGRWTISMDKHLN